MQTRLSFPPLVNGSASRASRVRGPRSRSRSPGRAGSPRASAPRRHEAGPHGWGAGPRLARPRESRHAKCACVGLPPAAGRFTQRLRAPRLRKPRTEAPLLGSEGRVGSAHPRGGLSPLTACAHRACAGGGRWLRLRLGTVRPSALAVRTLNSAENAAEKWRGK